MPIIDLGHGGSAGIATWREGNVLPREPATTKQVLLVLFFSVFDLLRKNHRKVVVCPPPAPHTEVVVSGNYENCNLKTGIFTVQ